MQMLFASPLHNVNVLLRQLADAVEVAFRHRPRIDQLTADAETARPGFEELGRRVQIEAAWGDLFMTVRVEEGSMADSSLGDLARTYLERFEKARPIPPAVNRTVPSGG